MMNQKKYLRIHKKILIFLMIIAVITMGIVTALLPQKEESSQDISGRGEYAPITETPTVTPSDELKQAIADQSVLDLKHANWQEAVEKEYPWKNKLPIYGDKFYVYFDLDKKGFIGLLYPQTGDDVEALKTDIIHTLKVNKQIPVENYDFQWQVNH